MIDKSRMVMAYAIWVAHKMDKKGLVIDKGSMTMV